MTIEEQFEDALKADEPMWLLREVIGGLLAEGYDRQSLMAKLETLRASLRSTGRTDDENAVIDVMSFLDGWCSSHVEL